MTNKVFNTIYFRLGSIPDGLIRTMKIGREFLQQNRINVLSIFYSSFVILSSIQISLSKKQGGLINELTSFCLNQSDNIVRNFV